MDLSTAGRPISRSTTAGRRADARAVARSQHGVFHRDQAAPLGLDRHALRKWADTGEIRREAGGVWVLTGSPRTDRQLAMAQLLAAGPGAVLGLWSAAALWGFSGFVLLPAHVVRHRHALPQARGARHSSTRLSERHVAILDDLPVTTVARTLFDLAGRLHEPRAEWLVDQALSRRLTSVPQLLELLDDLAERGRPGITVMRRLLQARDHPDFQPTDSNLELRFESILRRAGIGGFERQRTVGDAAGVVGRVDYRRLDPPVIVEIQSERYHRSLTDRVKDAERLARLRAAGWWVIEVPELDVWHHPDRVEAAVRAALKAAASVVDRPQP